MTNANGKTVTLLGGTGASTDSCQINKYCPALNLFNGDLSFLGNEKCLSSSTIKIPNQPVAEISVTTKRKKDTVERLSTDPVLQKTDHRMEHAGIIKGRLLTAANGPKNTNNTREVGEKGVRPALKRTPLSSLAKFAFTDKENRHDVRMGKRNRVATQQQSAAPAGQTTATARLQGAPATATGSRRNSLSLSQNQHLKDACNSAKPKTAQKSVFQSPGSCDSGSIASPTARPARSFPTATSVQNPLGTSIAAADNGSKTATMNDRKSVPLALQERPNELLTKVPPQRIQNPYGQKRSIGGAEKKTSTVSKFFTSAPRAKSKTQARRVTIENMPQSIGNARGDDCIDLTDSGANDYASKNHPKERPVFDYGEANHYSINKTAKKSRNNDDLDSWGSSDEVDSPDGSSKSSGLLSQAAVKPVSRCRIPPYRNPKKDPKKGPLAKAFAKAFSQDSPGSVNAVMNLASRRIGRAHLSQPKAKKQKTMKPFLSIQIFEKDVDDF